VTVTVSKEGKTESHFIDKRTKADGCYYGKNLSQNCLLPDVSQKFSGDFMLFQQEGVARCKVNSRVYAAERSQLHWAFCLAVTRQKQTRSESC